MCNRLGELGCDDCKKSAYMLLFKASMRKRKKPEPDTVTVGQLLKYEAKMVGKIQALEDHHNTQVKRLKTMLAQVLDDTARAQLKK